MSAQAESNGVSMPPPRTPSRLSNASDREPTPPSSDTLVRDEEVFAKDDDGDTIGPPHPFIAYARRVRSFASPLKLNKSRYLLTFVDEPIALQWWSLMQEEYPDSVRESDQLFSFKSGNVPARAWENPRFAHLRDKWTYRQLEGSGPLQESENVNAKQGKRRSLSRMLSTPSMHTIGEVSGPKEVRGHVRRDTVMEDPFIESAVTSRNTINLAELNRTLDRMHMMMNQTNLRIEALAERQQMYAESFEKMQTAMEENAKQLHALTTQQQAGALSNKNMRSSIEMNSSHIRTTLERQLHDSDITERMERRLQDTADRLDDVAKSQRASADDTRQTKSVVERTAEQIQTLLDRQSGDDGKLDTISATLEQVSTTTKASATRSPSGTPSAGSLQKLQTAVEQQAVHLTSIMNGQKVAHRSTQKTQAGIEQMTTDNKDINDRFDKLQAMTEQNAIWIKQHLAAQNSRFDKRVAAFETQAAKAEAANAEQQRHLTTLCAKMMDKMDKLEVSRCEHEVLPPPRKMKRKLVGYVYSRTG